MDPKNFNASNNCIHACNIAIHEAEKCIAVCKLNGGVATLEGDQFKQSIKECIDACKECIAECKQHLKICDHRGCVVACNECIKQCEACIEALEESEIQCSTSNPICSKGLQSSIAACKKCIDACNACLKLTCC